jgi:hypothetical protein
MAREAMALPQATLLSNGLNVNPKAGQAACPPLAFCGGGLPARLGRPLPLTSITNIITK